MKPERKAQLEKCIAILGLPAFRNLQLLDAALTHSSYANENKNRHVHFNERLNFSEMLSWTWSLANICSCIILICPKENFPKPGPV